MLPALQTARREELRAPLKSRLAAPAKNRGRLDVVADVLAACASAASKNAVLIRANVNSVTATYLLAQLMGTRLIDTVVDDEGRVAYITTKQGEAFLGSYRNLVGMLTASLVPETRAGEEIGLFA